jgi:peptidyl-prolyl cis-trans isomerase SurA
MFGNFTTCRNLLAAAMIMVAGAPAGMAYAQQALAIVNGEPITELEIEQRSRLTELATRKIPAREEVIDELRKERLRVHEAKKFGVEVPDSEVDEAYAAMASRMRRTPEQFTDALAKAGINADTLKHRIRADIAWQRYQRWRRQDPRLLPQQDSPPRGRGNG